jgi:hypothetical protein
MFKRTVLMVFAVGLLCCALSVPAHGQLLQCTAPFYCSAYSLWNPVCIPTPPANAFNPQVIPWSWTTVYTYLTTGCAPPPPPCCIKCGLCGNRGGAPISLVDGNTSIEETDVKIPGLSSGLSLTRTWISKWPNWLTSFPVGLFGSSWYSTYEERIFVGDDHYIKYTQSDGSFWSLTYAGAAYVPVSPANANAALTLDSASTYWTLTFQNG